MPLDRGAVEDVLVDVGMAVVTGVGNEGTLAAKWMGRRTELERGTGTRGLRAAPAAGTAPTIAAVVTIRPAVLAAAPSTAAPLGARCTRVAGARGLASTQLLRQWLWRGMGWMSSTACEASVSGNWTLLSMAGARRWRLLERPTGKGRGSVPATSMVCGCRRAALLIDGFGLLLGDGDVQLARALTRSPRRVPEPRILVGDAMRPSRRGQRDAIVWTELDHGPKRAMWKEAVWTATTVVGAPNDAPLWTVPSGPTVAWFILVFLWSGFGKE